MSSHKFTVTKRYAPEFIQRVADIVGRVDRDNIRFSGVYVMTTPKPEVACGIAKTLTDLKVHFKHEMIG